MKCKAATMRENQSVAFVVQVSEEQGKKIIELMKSSKIEALLYMKSNNQNIGIEIGFEDLWKVLPFNKFDIVDGILVPIADKEEVEEFLDEEISQECLDEKLAEHIELINNETEICKTESGA